MDKDFCRPRPKIPEKSYVAIQPKMTNPDFYVNSVGQVTQNSAKAYPVGLYQHKDPEESIIRRTRSLIPQSVKCQIVQMAQENPRITQGDIAQMFGIDRTTVSKILKRRHSFLEESKKGVLPPTDITPPKITKLDDVLNQHIYNYVETWYIDAKKRNKFITQSMVKEEANTVARGYGATSLSLSDQWFRDFFNRHNIREPDIEDLVKKEFEDPTSTDDLVFISPEAKRVFDQECIVEGEGHVNMSGWAGFTDEDLKRVRKLKVDKNDENVAKKNFRESPPKTTNANRGKLGSRVSHTVTSQDATSTKIGTPPPSSIISPVPRQQGNKIPKVQTETADTTRDDLVDVRTELEEIETNEALKREMGNLEKFREQQKMIEEANKQKKALLSKTLSERQRKAQEEARKLSHIQKEVAILDNLLTADVNVIRSRIELASREFLEAQRRYDRAEKEFVESKLDLQKKSELKEHLTEHLYTIIHQNEVRKAAKLSELMKELDMEQPSDSPILPSLPPLSSFNTMSSADTLHSPTKSHPQETKHEDDAQKTDAEPKCSLSHSTVGNDNSLQNQAGDTSKTTDVPSQQSNVKSSGDNESEKSIADSDQSNPCASGVSVDMTCDSAIRDKTVSEQHGESPLQSPETSDNTAKKNLIPIQPIRIIDDEGESCSTETQEIISTTNMPSAWTLEVVKNS